MKERPTLAHSEDVENKSTLPALYNVWDSVLAIPSKNIPSDATSSISSDLTTLEATLAEGITEELAEGRTEELAEGRTEELAEGRTDEDTEGLGVGVKPVCLNTSISWL